MKKARQKDEKKVIKVTIKTILLTMLHWSWKALVGLFLFSVIFSMVAIPLLIIFG